MKFALLLIAVMLGSLAWSGISELSQASYEAAMKQAQDLQNQRTR